MERLTTFVLRHRLWVVLFWLAVAVAGALNAPRTTDRLSYEFALPGQPAYEVNTAIVEELGTGGSDDPLVLVARGDGAEAAVTDLARAAERQVDGLLAVTPQDDGAESLASGSSAVAVLYPPVTPGPEPYAASMPQLEQLLERAGPQGGAEVQLTGFVPLTEGSASGGDRPVVVEIGLGAIGALVILAWVFASLLAGVPLLIAAVSILGTFLSLLGLTYVTDVSFVVQYLVGLIGLGVAIDYSLLLVTRWREERAGGADNPTAVRTAMRTAGHSVLFSGITVAVSLAALVAVPLPFLRSIGLGGLLIPLLSVATTLTLVPVILATAGDRLSWPRRARPAGASTFWARVTRGVLRHRWLTILGTSALLLALAAPVLGLRLGSPTLAGVVDDSPQAQAVERTVADGVPIGALRPVSLWTPDGSVDDVAAQARSAAGVAAVADPGWSSGGRTLLQVYLTEDPSSDAGRDDLSALRQSLEGSFGDDLVGGSPAEDADFVSAVYGDAVWVLLAVVLATFLLLARALRSLWLPVKALLLNAISIAAAYGITVLVWQHGWGSELLFGQQATGVISVWVPVAAFSFLFGLSMDYEVFILSRMREAYDEHGDTDRAAVDGIAHTGRLVTSAALILFWAFVALSTVPAVEVKILATTLALGILLDAVVVRSLLAPALVGVLGRTNWTVPRWLAAVVRVPATSPAPRGRHRA